MYDLAHDLESTQGGRYRCPACDARRGLSLDADKGDTGVWHCFACQCGGTGAELYAEMHGVTISQALDAFGVSSSEMERDIKRKETQAPRPSLPDYSAAEWAERTRVWRVMTPDEVRLRALYRERRTQAREARDRSVFDKWQARMDALHRDVLERERRGELEAQQLDANTEHLISDQR